MPTVQETSIGEQLKSLIRLQHLDTQIDQVAKLRGDLPDEIRDLEDEKAGLETRILKYRQEREENEAASLQAERDIKEAEGLIKKYEEQQLQVRNNREYDALTKEIEAQKQRIVDAQAKIEEVANTREGSEALVTETETRLGELTTVLESKQKDLKEVLEDTKQEQAELEGKRSQAEEAVDSRYLRAYKRLRNRLRDGRAVVPLERGAAAGFAVPPQRQMEIRQRNRIVACEHTGRIIVDSELYQETVKDLQ
jgi:predicted  nucleic acid-binding Zn-ribbon protein